MRKRGQQTGLDTPVVHVVNDDNYKLNFIHKDFTVFFKFYGIINGIKSSVKANALNYPPEKYGRKI